MSLASIGNAAVTRLRCMVPRWGCWWIDADLSGEVALSGAVVLKLADVSFSGTIVSGGVADGRSAYRIVGGRGGWGKPIKREAYHDDAGVKADTVLRDAASAAGETLTGVSVARRLGPHFARVEGYPASAALNYLYDREWRMGFDGVTRIGAYPDSTYTGDGTRTERRPGSQVIEIATDKIATLVPGVSVDGSLPATDVEYALDKDRLTVKVLTGRHSTRRLGALARQVMALFPDIQYRGVFEFRVVTQEGERLNLQPARAASGMPDLPRVPVRPGMAGLKAMVQLGELVLVAFADADPSRPQVISHDAPDAPGWQPLTLDIGGPATLGIAYQGSPVVAGPFAGTVTLGSVRFKVSPV